MNAPFSANLLDWYDQFGRHDLPWQINMTPYRVWVSEIMLQQTQVQTVIPYYQRFMARFPDLEALAHASQEEVLAHWSGLGYYARGRNLHAAAQKICDEFKGVFPSNVEDVLALPGIGRSTAGAILALAFKQRYAILDGNVKRVLCRYDAVETWSGEPKTQADLWQRAEALTPQSRFDDYTQAIMDLGATLCKRSRPNCEFCPVKQGCQAYQQDKVSNFPVAKPKRTKPIRATWMLYAQDAQGNIGLYRRPQTGIWGGLWSLPEFDALTDLVTALPQAALAKNLIEIEKFKHTFTHYHLWIHPVCVSLTTQSLSELSIEVQWFNRLEALALGLPAPVRTILEIKNV